VECLVDVVVLDAFNRSSGAMLAAVISDWQRAANDFGT